MEILYVGQLNHGSTCLHRLRTMQELGHSLTAINSAPPWIMENTKPSLYYRLINKMSGPPDLAQVNEKIVNFISKDKFDLLWLDKGLEVKAKTFRKVKELSTQTSIIGYYPDDAGYDQSKNFLACLPYYDLFCINRTCNVQELKDLGCPRVMVIGKGYDPATHRPMDLSAEEKERLGGPVGFIGGFESQRAQSIAFLAKRGVLVGVWGNGWKENCKLKHNNLVIKGASIYGDDYAKGICSFDIVLGFLRKRNRDLHTSRSLEIPACGAFMLAERTDEHLALFEEGKEAEFFETDEEMLEKVRYYLDHEAERQQIARAGRERCLKSGYNNHERLKEILARIDRA
jgi:spore maturation protein CgeB